MSIHQFTIKYGANSIAPIKLLNTSSNQILFTSTPKLQEESGVAYWALDSGSSASFTLSKGQIDPGQMSIAINLAGTQTISNLTANVDAHGAMSDVAVSTGYQGAPKVTLTQESDAYVIDVPAISQNAES